MNDNVLIALLSSIGGGILLLFGITSQKVDKSDFKDHCKEQKEAHDQFWESINKNNELLARVDERLKREEK